MGSGNEYIKKIATEAAKQHAAKLNTLTNNVEEGSWHIGHVSPDRKTVTLPNGEVGTLTFTGNPQEYTQVVKTGPNTYYAPANQPQKVSVLGGGDKAVLLVNEIGTKNILMIKIGDTSTYKIDENPGLTAVNPDDYIVANVSGAGTSAYALSTDGKTIVSLHIDGSATFSLPITIKSWDNITLVKDEDNITSFSAQTIGNFIVPWDLTPNPDIVLSTFTSAQLCLVVGRRNGDRKVYIDYTMSQRIEASAATDSTSFTVTSTINTLLPGDIINPSIITQTYNHIDEDTFKYYSNNIWVRKLDILLGAGDGGEFITTAAIKGSDDLTDPFKVAGRQLFRSKQDSTAALWISPQFFNPAGNYYYSTPTNTTVQSYLGIGDDYGFPTYRFPNYNGTVRSAFTDLYAFNNPPAEILATNFHKVIDSDKILTVTNLGPDDNDVVNAEVAIWTYNPETATYGKRKVKGKVPSQLYNYVANTGLYGIIDAAIIGA